MTVAEVGRIYAGAVWITLVGVYAHWINWRIDRNRAARRRHRAALARIGRQLERLDV